MKRVLCALAAAARFASALPLSILAQPNNEVKILEVPQVDAQADAQAMKGVEKADENLEEVVNEEENGGGAKCGPNNRGICEAPHNNECKSKNLGFAHAAAADGQCAAHQWCCVPAKLLKMMNADIAVQQPQGSSPAKVFRVISAGRVWGMKPDKAFFFEHNQDFISIYPRKNGAVGNAAGVQGVFLKKSLFGAQGLNLQFAGVEGGISHTKSSGWWSKKKSPAVTVSSNQLAGLNLAKVKVLLVSSGITTQEKLNDMSNEEKAEFDEKATSVLGTLKALPDGMIVDPSIEDDEITDQQTEALVAEVKKMFTGQ